MEASTYSKGRDRQVLEEQAAFFDVFKERHHPEQVDDPADRDRLEAMRAAGPRYEPVGKKPYLNRYDSGTNTELARDVNGRPQHSRQPGGCWF